MDTKATNKKQGLKVNLWGKKNDGRHQWLHTAKERDFTDVVLMGYQTNKQTKQQQPPKRGNQNPEFCNVI